MAGGKIFLADERGLVETDRFRRYSTFSFGPYQHPHKQPFGALRACNEETLAPGHALEFRADEDTYLLLLPITGELESRPETGFWALTPVAEITLLPLLAGSRIQLRNPAATELSSFLHLWLHADFGAVPPVARHFAFDWLATENQLVSLLPPSLPFAVHLGRFLGRHEAALPVRPGGQVFAFVLAGAFELAERLLHEKDGLALWDVAEVEMEALSNQAIVLLVELPPPLAAV